MKRFCVIFLVSLFLAGAVFAQSRKETTSSRNGIVTPDGYLGKVTLAFDAGFQVASGDHTNVSNGERQDMNFNNFNLEAGILYPATQTLTFHLDLGFINTDTNWKGNIFLDEHDFDLSGLKMNFGVKVYLK